MRVVRRNRIISATASNGVMILEIMENGFELTDIELIVSLTNGSQDKTTLSSGGEVLFTRRVS